MFSKASKTPVVDARAVAVNARMPRPVLTGHAPSTIANDMQVHGNLTSKGELRVDGSVDGDVRAQIVTIGESGSVKGAVNADEAYVHGRVEGTVRAGKVLLAHTGHVLADIVHGRLVIEEGARFEGQCKQADKPVAELEKPVVMLPGAAKTER
jgi:cytoskeletal protein CcmA (bactofilin family)